MWQFSEIVQILFQWQNNTTVLVLSESWATLSMRFKHCSVINLFNFGKGRKKLRVDCWDIRSAKIHLLELIHDFPKLEHLTVIVMEVPDFLRVSQISHLSQGWMPVDSLHQRFWHGHHLGMGETNLGLKEESWRREDLKGFTDLKSREVQRYEIHLAWSKGHSSEGQIP